MDVYCWGFKFNKSFGSCLARFLCSGTPTSYGHLNLRLTLALEF